MRFALPIAALLAVSPALAQQAQPQGDPIDPNAFVGYYQKALGNAEAEAAQLAGAFAAQKAKLETANKQVADLRQQVEALKKKLGPEKDAAAPVAPPPAATTTPAPPPGNPKDEKAP